MCTMEYLLSGYYINEDGDEVDFDIKFNNLPDAIKKAESMRAEHISITWDKYVLVLFDGQWHADVLEEYVLE